MSGFEAVVHAIGKYTNRASQTGYSTLTEILTEVLKFKNNKNTLTSSPFVSCHAAYMISGSRGNLLTCRLILRERLESVDTDRNTDG